MHIKNFFLAKGVDQLTADVLANQGKPEDSLKWWH